MSHGGLSGWSVRRIDEDRVCRECLERKDERKGARESKYGEGGTKEGGERGYRKKRRKGNVTIYR